MAISNINPSASSTIEPGRAIVFVVDNTYTTMTIEVETDTGWEYAYDSTLGGAQPGYTVTVAAGASTDSFVTSRDAGWDLSPFNFRVIEDESATVVTTTISYTLSAEAPYPQGTNPYNETAPGTGSSTIALQFAGRAASASINTYLQNSGTAPWDYSGWNQTRTGAQGSPNAPDNSKAAGSMVIPFDGIITQITGWMQMGVAGDTGDLELWRWRPTDNEPLSSATGAQINAAPLGEYGTIGYASGDLREIDIASPTNGSVTKGDILEPLIYVDGSSISANGHFMLTVLIEET